MDWTTKPNGSIHCSLLTSTPTVMTDVQGLLGQSTRSLQTTTVRDMTTEENLHHTKHQDSDVQQNH